MFILSIEMFGIKAKLKVEFFFLSIDNFEA